MNLTRRLGGLREGLRDGLEGVGGVGLISEGIRGAGDGLEGLEIVARGRFGRHGKLVGD